MPIRSPEDPTKFIVGDPASPLGEFLPRFPLVAIDGAQPIPIPPDALISLIIPNLQEIGIGPGQIPFVLQGFDLSTWPFDPSHSGLPTHPTTPEVVGTSEISPGHLDAPAGRAALSASSIAAAVDPVAQRSPGSGTGTENPYDALLRTNVIRQDIHFDRISTVPTRLIDLRLLQRLPLHYLIPDDQLLPAESMRFFYLDPFWIKAAVDGALSAATTSRRQRMPFHDLYERIWEVLNGPRATGGTATSSVRLDGTVTGFVMRSNVVGRWPSLRVSARDSGDNELGTFIERLTPSLLVCLIVGVPQEIDVIEPSAETGFGVVERAGSWFEPRVPAQSSPSGGSNSAATISLDTDGVLDLIQFSSSTAVAVALQRGAERVRFTPGGIT